VTDRIGGAPQEEARTGKGGAAQAASAPAAPPHKLMELRPSGFCNYRADVTRMVGNIYGPSLDGVYHLAITAENQGRRIGFFALDTEDAKQAAEQWLQARDG